MKAWAPIAINGKKRDLLVAHLRYVLEQDAAREPDRVADPHTRIAGVATRLTRLPDPYDLALSKLTRNLEIDIEDMEHLAEACNLDIGVLSRSAMTPSFGQLSSGPSSVTTRRFSCGPKPSGNNGEAGVDCDPNCDPTLPKYGVLLRFTDC